jgi:uncharacterized RDD family membrane protein YckC
MNDSVSSNRFAPPQALVSDEALASEGLQLATRLQRFCATFIDGLFAMVLSAVVMLPMYGTSYFQTMARDKSAVLGGLVLYVSIFYVVEGLFLYRRSQSLGKIAMALRIVRPDGSHASFGRAFGVRLVAFGLSGYIPLVGPFVSLVDVLFIFGKRRRCLHDLAADTIVVTAASAPLPAAAAA